MDERWERKSKFEPYRLFQEKKNVKQTEMLDLTVGKLDQISNEVVGTLSFHILVVELWSLSKNSPV